MDDRDYLETILLRYQRRVEMIPPISINRQLKLINPFPINLDPMHNRLIINPQINRAAIRIQESTDILQHNARDAPGVLIFEHLELVVPVFD